ncbi:MAG: amino acid ABC transporter permease [Candidatus Schekmanbacteria bacterium]|nr:amino acid ABC transporter permease [Candidatus Schekmanbacteria bacterium]
MSALRDTNVGGGTPRWWGQAAAWVGRNLFATWYDGLLTLALLAGMYAAGGATFRWMVTAAGFGSGPEACASRSGACWAFVYEMGPLFLVGSYPFAERWRPLAALAVLAVLVLASVFERVRRHRLFFPLCVASSAGAALLVRGAGALGLPPVDAELWGGALLTIALSSAGIAAAFPLGVLLALGRTSRALPVIRTVCASYIELVRGVPLVTLLFMSSVMLPLFFPPGFEISKVFRAQIAVVLFSAAYVAEVVRGGLHAVPRGQVEAAHALGLTWSRTMALVVLPQALRAVIGPLVSTFIALLKDTSLVAIIGLHDLLGMAALTTANPRWVGRMVEAYVVVAALYWMLCSSLSRFGRYAENRRKEGSP